MSYGLGKRRSPVERGKQHTNKQTKKGFELISGLSTPEKDPRNDLVPCKQFLFHQNEMC